jgi:23S rRNA (adenine2030-N6)-methyltransferase
MLSYQHGYHAGNFADVHKHAALCLLLRHLLLKPTPFCVLDSHGGAGRYDLTGAQAAKTGEWQSGIGHLWGKAPRSAGLSLYLEQVRALNPAGALRPLVYPGSPLLSLAMGRPCDRVVLMELHPAEHAALRRALKGHANAELHRRDGFEGVRALVPPAERRGLVLMDPAYEMKDDYARVPDCAARILARWRDAIIVAWFPILPEARHEALITAFEKLAVTGREILLDCLFTPRRKRGMAGSGLVVVNPPWHFADNLAEAGGEAAALLFGAAGRHEARMLATAKTVKA